MSDDEDEEDLWADFDDDDAGQHETTINVSANLAEAVTHAPQVVHQGDADEGKLTWESPAAPGLDNSHKVNEGSTTHWYKEDAVPAAPPPSMPPPSFAPPSFPPPVAMQPAPAPPMPAMMPFPAKDIAAPAFSASPFAVDATPPTPQFPPFAWSAFATADGGLPKPGSLFG